MADKLNTVTAVIYARYSDRGQKDESIEQQVAECELYAKSNNMTVVEVYADRGITGKTDRRPEFQKMMRHAEKKRFSVVIAYKSNRMGRDMLHSLMYEDKLSQFGVRCVYAKEEFGDNAAGRFALRTMMNVSQFYSENMAEDIKRGLLYNAERCMIANGSLPLGYRKGEDGKFALDAPNADIVREIFSRVAEQEPFVKIASDLNSRGVPTGAGGQWGKNSFRSILENERYTGVYIYDKIRVEGGVPQIIDKEVFLKVQDYLRTKKNPRGRARENGEYILTGKLFCGSCGSPMIGKSGTGRAGALFSYYVCKARDTDKSCIKEYVRRDWIEREVAHALKDMLSDKNVVNSMADDVVEFINEYKSRSDIAILENQLREVKKALANMVSAIEQGVITATTKERIEELESAQKRFENQLLVERSEVLDISKENLIYWYESFRFGDIDKPEYQKALFDNILIGAYVYDDHFKIDINATQKRRKNKVPFAFVDNIDECSHKECNAPPRQDNPDLEIVPIGEGFGIISYSWAYGSRYTIQILIMANLP